MGIHFNHKSKAGDRKMQKELKLKQKSEERKKKREEQERLKLEEEMRQLEELTKYFYLLQQISSLTKLLQNK